MTKRTKQVRLLGVLLMGGVLMNSVGCIQISGRTYNEIITTSVKTVAATLLDIIVINNLQALAN